MQRLINWFHNLALYKKITYTVIVAGIIPISLIFIVSVNRLKSGSVEMQMYMLNKGYEQTYQSIDGFLARMYNMSTLATVNDYIRTALKGDLNSLSYTDELLLFEDVTSFAYSLELNMDEVNVLYYIDDKYLMAKQTNSRYRPASYLEQKEWAEILKNRNGIPTWVVMDERNEYGKKAEYLGIVRTLWDEDDYLKSLGSVAVITDRKEIGKMLISSLADQVFYLETRDGQVVVSNNNFSIYEDLVKEFRINSSDQFLELKVNNKRYYVRRMPVDNGDLYFTSIIPRSSLYADTSRITGNMLLWYIVVCLLLYLLSIPISRVITYRIKLLDTKMNEEGKLLKLEVEPHKDEIGRLILRYNNIVEKVENLMEEQFMMGQEKIGAELKALQSQINPHFLYNTLDMLNWMAKKNETENIQAALQAMSSFYRMALSKGHDIISIKDEIKMCDAYIRIQTMRYKGKIQFEVDIQTDIMECQIPKITLQPLIENAIIHGISEKKDGRGIVIVNGWIEEVRIILSVTDDGTGMEDTDLLSSKSQGSHYGMSNIEKRLTLYYGEPIKLQVDSSLGIGTCISINIPIRN